jgi:predicted RNA binding protein YcfA (HicA-like mRNA interferase family)
MSRIVPIPYWKLVRILEMEGFVLDRQRGDHMIFTKSGIPRPAVVPKDNPVPVFIIANILRTARISRERYFELLRKV